MGLRDGPSSQWLVLYILAKSTELTESHPTSDIISDAISIPIWVAVLSLGTIVTAILAIACCACDACQSKGATHPQTYNTHTHELKQLVHSTRKKKPIDIKEVAKKLYQIGVRAETAFTGIEDLEELERLGITVDDINFAGGKQAIIKELSEIKKVLDADKKNAVKPTLRYGEPFLPPKLAAPPILVPIPPEMGNRTSNTDASKNSLNSETSSSARGKTAPPVSTGPEIPGMVSLDQAADFDDYTIYEQGELNEYGVLKAEKERKQEMQVGLDEAADFDDYTIYQEGPLNEYGILKSQGEKKQDDAVGLDTHADFDDYTIYDEGSLNEYGVLKAQKEKQYEEAVGLDEHADFDDYTIYEEGELNEYGVLKAQREQHKDAGIDSNMERSTRRLHDEGMTSASQLVDHVVQETPKRPKIRVKTKVRRKVERKRENKEIDDVDSLTELDM